jgi:hypothetical protein
LIWAFCPGLRPGGDLHLHNPKRKASAVFQEVGKRFVTYLGRNQFPCPYYAALFTVSCLASSSTLKMEAISPSETSVNFYLTTRRCIPKDNISEIPQDRLELTDVFIVRQSDSAVSDTESGCSKCLRNVSVDWN